MARPQMMAPRGSIDPNKITSEPGLIMFYQPGMQPPQPFQMQNLPPYVLQELDRNIFDMNDISSQHEISRGQVPPNVEAATAIAYLQEQDDTVLAHTLFSIELAHQRIGRHVLSHANQFWDAQRTIKVTGRNNVVESFIFSQADVRGATDYRVTHGSATPRSRAAKQAWITELIKMGVIPPQLGLQYLDMAETTRIYDDMQIDAKHAQRENMKMQQGQPTTVNIYDNHMVHITEHEAFMKRQEFEQLDEGLRMMFIEHVETHKVTLAGQFGIMLPPMSPMLDGFVRQILGQIPPMPGMMPGQEQMQEDPNAAPTA
jgi:hypothetical protein